MGHFMANVQKLSQNSGPYTRGVRGVKTHFLFGYIISNSCSSSPEAKFTPLTLAPNQDFLKIPNPFCKLPEICSPLFFLCTGLELFSTTFHFYPALIAH